ncbi:MAG: cytosol nonspecific dipeptidase [Bacteroidetes bacterium]|nr:MAG: cytosol nonspecific dipeptidase [Bacteroidota bacterium]
MSDEVRALEPQVLWNYFADLNEVPRGSKKEKKAIEFAKNFGESLGLETMVDQTGNVIIKKPATAGMEDRGVIALQSHLDMVHQKNADTDFDFDTQGIQMYVEGDWVKAKGTTLGADNGIGVAAIMTLLASDDIPHPALEALLTMDEETGMTGAKGLQGGLLDAKVMLNLDTEDDDELTIGCAGGIDVTADGSYNQVSLDGDNKSFTLSMKGLTGGHSGMEIQLGRGNANKLMNRFLTELANDVEVSIHAIDGGGLRNAIPRESSATISVSTSNLDKFQNVVSDFNQILAVEYATTDAGAELVAEPIDGVGTALDAEFQSKLLKGIYACPSGIYRMSPDIEGLVQTSNNLARVLVKDGQYQILCLTRSSSTSEKNDEVNAIRGAFELMGANVSTAGSYPGWEPKPEAGIVKLMQQLYSEMYKEEAHVSAIHAGLECGILGTNYPDIEMISFGPNIRGAHSPDEKAQISSVQKFWSYLLETLKKTA